MLGNLAVEGEGEGLSRASFRLNAGRDLIKICPGLCKFLIGKENDHAPIL
jgi:hypothetical protein